MKFTRGTAVVGLTVVTLLSGCSSGLNAESFAKSQVQESDFRIPVAQADDEGFISDVEWIFGGDCTPRTDLERLLKTGSSLGLISFEDRNDDQSNFQVIQQAIQLASAEEVSKAVELAEAGAKNDDCGFSKITTSGTTTGVASTRFSNVRSAEQAFGVKSDSSIAWDKKYTMYFIGSIYGSAFDSTEEGGAVFAGKGSVLVITYYETEIERDADERVARTDLEVAVQASLKRLFG